MYLWILESTSMSTTNIPQTGLPQGLFNIPFGQIFILTNPNIGITAKTIKLIEFIPSMARKVGQKSHVVNSLPVQNPDLWECFVCKVKTEDGVQILVADKDSLLEMLCEFWGLDYDKVIKIPDIIPGWHKKNKGVTIGGEQHPVRVPGMGRKDGTIYLESLQDHSREKTLLDIRSTFKDNFSYGWDITPEDILKIFEEEKAATKTYSLDIQVVWKEVIEKIKPIKKIHKCNISLIDNEGNRYPLKMKAQSKAIYLTFILYPDGLRIQDVSNNGEFYKLFSKIFDKMPRALDKPDPFVFFDKDYNYTREYGLFNDKLNNIRKAILDATGNNDYLRERFAVEGDVGFPYKVAGATDEHRALIKKEFGLK